uniref:Uncharacterized protein n=1 Tax=Oryza sativa subsp. japonica TaxID=39947 RepID=Q2QZR4_ORYSJ|nr:hypothetical protein LOC_Os11g45110 [Oryza sativa Japonica Group]
MAEEARVGRLTGVGHGAGLPTCISAQQAVAGGRVAHRPTHEIYKKGFMGG